MGRAAPEVTQLELVLDGEQDRRRLDTHFGFWVVGIERHGSCQLLGLNSGGEVLSWIDI